MRNHRLTPVRRLATLLAFLTCCELAAGGSDAHRVASPGALAGFVENRGQWSDEILFFARGPASEVIVTAEGFWLAPNRGLEPERAVGAPDPVFVRLPGGATLEPGAALPTAHHFILAGGTTRDVPGYASVTFRGVEPGIDVVLRRDGAWFAYDVVAGAGADLASFAIVVEGVHGIAHPSSAELLLAAGADQLVHRIGDVWQDAGDGSRLPLTASIETRGVAPSAFEVSFDVPEWSGDRRLVIDPTLMYLTYIGTALNDGVTSIDVDGTGAVVIFGGAPGGPTTPNTLQPDLPLGSALWLGKLTPGGTALEWATYVGGSASQTPEHVAFCGDGSVVIAGRTWSADFPVTPAALQSQIGGLSDLYVTRITADGAALVWSTYLGGSGQDGPQAVTLAPNGDVVVALDSSSSDLAATPGAFDTSKDGHDKLIARIASDGSALVFATWLPMLRFEALAVDDASDIYYAGHATAGSPSPTTPGAYQPAPIGTTTDAVVGKLAGDGGTVLWGTYIGGTKSDTAYGLAVDAAHAVYVAGLTSSDDFPVSTGALMSALGFPGAGGFVAKLTADGRALAWATYLSGCCSGGGHLQHAAVDRAGNVTVVGFTNHGNWPTTADALQPFFIGPTPSPDVVMSKLDALGRSAVYSTYIGGSGGESEAQLALDANDRPHVAIKTYSADLFVTPGAYQPQHGGGTDIAVAGFDLPLLPWRVKGGQSQLGPHVPNLAGVGTLEPGSATTLAVRGGAPHGFAWLVVSSFEIALPLPELACVLHPLPDVLVPLVLDDTGAVDIDFAWPQSGASTLHFQLFGLHFDAPGFLYASNGLSTAP